MTPPIAASRTVLILRCISLAADECIRQGGVFYYLTTYAVRHGKSEGVTAGEVVEVLNKPLSRLLV